MFQCHYLKISIIPHINIMWVYFNQFHLPLKLPRSTLLGLCVNANLLHLLTYVQKCQQIQKAVSEYISVFSVGSFHTSSHFIPVRLILLTRKGNYNSCRQISFSFIFFLTKNFLFPSEKGLYSIRLIYFNTNSQVFLLKNNSFLCFMNQKQ